MTELKKTPDRDEEQSMSATARLPWLEISLRHCRLPGQAGEELTIRLRAIPSFESLGRTIEAANPFAAWAAMLQLAWAPWLMASQIVQDHGLAPRLAGPRRPPLGE
jgi:hypothetical protein